jgi:hypothetical protein
MDGWIKSLTIGVCAAVLSGSAAYAVFHFRHSAASAGHPAPWNSDAIRATFAGVQVRQVDTVDAAVVFFYDLENTTDFDYRMENGPSMDFLSRLRSDGSLSSEDQPHLDHAAFVPARNRTHIGIEVVRPFAWPAQNAGGSDEKFRELVKRETDNLNGFVVFDERMRYQVELPGARPGGQQGTGALTN